MVEFLATLTDSLQGKMGRTRDSSVSWRPEARHALWGAPNIMSWRALRLSRERLP